MNGGYDEQFAAVARELRAGKDVQDTLDRAVSLAVDLIEGCDHAGVSQLHQRSIETRAATSEAVRRGDELQYELAEGPCLDAVWAQTEVSSPDLAVDERWPIWGPLAAKELALHGMLCFRLFTEDRRLGALNLYSARLDGFSDDDRDEGGALATHVAVAMGAAEEIENLNVAVARRTTIGQAEGILMERFDLTPDDAFAVLRRVSQDSNTKLHDVAIDLVRTRRLPENPP